MPKVTPAENNDSATPISLPAAARKKLTATFDGGQVNSDGNVVFMTQAEEIIGKLDASKNSCVLGPILIR